MNTYTATQSRFTHFFFADARSAPLWFIIRLYVGYEWVSAGIEKMMNPAWFGFGAGAGMKGFVAGALAKTAGAHPDVQAWYAWFLTHVVVPNLTLWCNSISLGEVLVGLGLITGVLTGTAAFFGALMNLNFMLSGSVSVNPQMFVLEVFLVAAHRVAGVWGLGRYLRSFTRARRSPYQSTRL